MKKSDYEPVDNTPVEMPTRLRLPQTRTEQIRQFIRQELSFKAQQEGVETFQEADDFEIEDDQEPFSPYEVIEFDGDPTLEEAVSPSGEQGVVAPADPAQVKPATPNAGDGGNGGEIPKT